MLKYDVESKGARDVPQVDQPDLYLPSESELQMAQVGLVAGFPVVQIEDGLFSKFYCVYLSQQSREIAKLTSDLRELKQSNEDLKQKVQIFDEQDDLSFLKFIAQS